MHSNSAWAPALVLISQIGQEEIMSTSRSATCARSMRLLLTFVVAALGAVCTVLASPQSNAPAQLPNGPAKPGFDIRRFSLNGGIFKTFDVEQTEPLQKVLQ